MKDTIIHIINLFIGLILVAFIIILIFNNNDLSYKIENIDSINRKNEIVIKELQYNLDYMKGSFIVYLNKLNTIDSSVNLIDKNRTIKINNFNIQKDSIQQLIDKLKDETIITIPDIPINN